VDFDAFSAELRPRLAVEMQRQLSAIQLASLNRAMGHLLGRGKLFRPLLVLAAARAVSGGAVAELLPLATPVELIHTFTLIHDDLPAMDDAQLRRGVPAVHLAYDEATAVLAGDALLSWALYLLGTEPPDLPASTRLALVAEASFATKEVVEGQMLDLAGEGQHLDLAELEHLHSKKTGALLGACCALGALLAGASPVAVDELRQLGIQIGLAFQIRDDLLSLQSTEEEMGKTLETDTAKHKSTYPRLLGLDLLEPDVLREMAFVAGQRVT
jgi:geranylgeranyl diphosphate synthase type II